MKQKQMLAIRTLDYFRRLEVRKFSPFVRLDSSSLSRNKDGSKLSRRSKNNSRNRAMFTHKLALVDCSMSFLDIAQAALSCDMLTDALLYVELHMKTGVRNNESGTGQCSIEDLYNIPNHIEALFEVYTKLRDIDGTTMSVFHGLALQRFPQFAIKSRAVLTWKPLKRVDNGEFLKSRYFTNLTTTRFEENVAIAQTSWENVLQRIHNNGGSIQYTAWRHHRDKIKHLLAVTPLTNIDTSLGELQSVYILNKMRWISTAASGDNNGRNNDLHRLHDIKGILNIWGTTLVKKSRDWHSFSGNIFAFR